MCDSSIPVKVVIHNNLSSQVVEVTQSVKGSEVVIFVNATDQPDCEKCPDCPGCPDQFEGCHL